MNLDKTLEVNNFILTRNDRLNLMMAVAFPAASISLIYLLVRFTFKQLVISTTTITLQDQFSNFFLDNPTLYVAVINLMMLIYLVILIIALPWSYRRRLDTIRLHKIRDVINHMAKGNYDVRIPNNISGKWYTLAQSANTLMDNIQKAIHEQQLAEKTKDELITNIGHDIRTPLTAMIANLTILKDAEKTITSKQRKEFIKKTYDQAQAMKSLVNDLFDYTESAQSTIELNLMELPIDMFLQQIAAEFEDMASKKGIELKVIVADKKLTAKLDPDKMARIFNNLISNAIKYGEGATEITLTAFRENHKIIFEVINNGILVPKEQLESIYERSYRGDQSRNLSERGSGLGLSIVRNFVSLHGGNTYAYHKNGEMAFRIEIE